MLKSDKYDSDVGVRREGMWVSKEFRSVVNFIIWYIVNNN